MLKPKRIRYGPHRSNVGDLWLPVSHGEKIPVVVLIHGGFWRAVYVKRLMNGLARDVVKRGWAAWNIEYRRVGLFGGGGGWPRTLLDVAAALDHLADMSEGIDLTRVVTCGHSAGGQLAMWAAARSRLPAGSPGAEPAVSILGAISLAGIVDLQDADRLRLGGDATAKFMGGHWEQLADRYRSASPMALLPLGVPQVLIHARNDRVVPSSMSRNYEIQATKCGDSARYVPIDGVGHRQLINPNGAAWESAVSELAHIIG